MDHNKDLSNIYMLLAELFWRSICLIKKGCSMSIQMTLSEQLEAEIFNVRVRLIAFLYCTCSTLY